MWFNSTPYNLIFASQGFRSQSPLSSPLADWAGFCNFSGSPSSGFHRPILQRWHHFWPMGAFNSFVFKHVAIVYIFNSMYMWCFRDILLAAIWLDAAMGSSSSICQGWREGGPWAKPLASKDAFELTWIPFTQGCFVPSLVEIGPVVLEKKSKIGKVYRQTDDGRQAIRKAYLSFQLRWAIKGNSQYSLHIHHQLIN